MKISEEDCTLVEKNIYYINNSYIVHDKFDFYNYLLFDYTNDTLYGGGYECIVKKEDYSGTSIADFAMTISHELTHAFGKPSSNTEKGAIKNIESIADSEIKNFGEYRYIDKKQKCVIWFNINGNESSDYTRIKIEYKIWAPVGKPSQ
ncbi:MAG: hypothetical protein IJ460_05065 [Clostridia bacterium]|nr:hypothetical protein [Clostridia bacterium]